MASRPNCYTKSVQGPPDVGAAVSFWAIPRCWQRCCQRRSAVRRRQTARADIASEDTFRTSAFWRTVRQREWRAAHTLVVAGGGSGRHPGFKALSWPAKAARRVAATCVVSSAVEGRPAPAASPIRSVHASPR